jgi:hypothetical protein
MRPSHAIRRRFPCRKRTQKVAKNFVSSCFLRPTRLKRRQRAAWGHAAYRCPSCVPETADEPGFARRGKDATKGVVLNRRKPRKRSFLVPLRSLLAPVELPGCGAVCIRLGTGESRGRGEPAEGKSEIRRAGLRWKSELRNPNRRVAPEDNRSASSSAFGPRISDSLRISVPRSFGFPASSFRLLPSTFLGRVVHPRRNIGRAAPANFDLRIFLPTLCAERKQGPCKAKPSS